MIIDPFTSSRWTNVEIFNKCQACPLKPNTPPLKDVNSPWPIASAQVLPYLEQLFEQLCWFVSGEVGQSTRKKLGSSWFVHSLIWNTWCTYKHLHTYTYVITSAYTYTHTHTYYVYIRVYIYIFIDIQYTQYKQTKKILLQDQCVLQLLMAYAWLNWADS